VTITSIYDLGLQIGDLERERMVHEYYQVLRNLYETKVKTPLFPESFFQTLAKHSDARFLLTELNGKIIGGTVCVAQEGKCLYEWFACGEDGVYPHVFPSCYATYAGIKYAAEHDMPRFDMMGAGKSDEAYGVRDFKEKFGGKKVEHGRFLCIKKPLLYRIGVLGVKLLKKLK
jgi:lipid II:glycine glycyltransferase (peptidoglycan interpeptide bridge formation enzyme)